MFLDLSADTLYPADHLPWGLGKPRGAVRQRPLVRVGDFAVDLAVLASTGYFDAAAKHALTQDVLNDLMELGPQAWDAVRAEIARFLSGSDDRDDVRSRAVHPLAEVALCLPAHIGDYTDFYSSREHATNVGTMFRGADNALMPNWLHLPVGYHGRASSVVVSGHDVRRPMGQIKPPDGPPVFAPSKELDVEIEMGAFVGQGNPLGTTVSADEAERHVFGLCLVNDWSARDVQRWEYVPLGPFLAKNFLTTVSPWIVSLVSLEGARCEAPVQDPAPLPYLAEAHRRGFDIELIGSIQTATMDAPAAIIRTNTRFLYWTLAQQIAHHTMNGCNLRPGDLLASGTISGPEPGSEGSLLELAWKGTRPVELPSGETRIWLEDGDTFTITASATRSDGQKVGFGEVVGTVVSA